MGPVSMSQVRYVCTLDEHLIRAEVQWPTAHSVVLDRAVGSFCLRLILLYAPSCGFFMTDLNCGRGCGSVGRERPPPAEGSEVLGWRST